MNLYTTQDVANALGISTRRVQHLAQELGVGRRLNPRMLVFTDDDVVILRARKTTTGPAKAV